MKLKNAQPLLYPNHYRWLVFVSAIGMLMTALVLFLGGEEADLIARLPIMRYGLAGLVVLAVLLVAVLILLCEMVGRRMPPAGNFLAWFGVAISSASVLVAFVLLIVHIQRQFDLVG